MQRIIKFRAWLDESKWTKEPRIGMLSFDQIKDKYAGEMVNMFEDPDITLMQYTGLKDKNGVEIYDGDIVDDHYFESYVSRHKVYWADNYGCWSTMGLTFPVPERKQLAYFHEVKRLHRNEDLEVIGNIYENPELLEYKYPELLENKS